MLTVNVHSSLFRSFGFEFWIAVRKMYFNNKCHVDINIKNCLISIYDCRIVGIPKY